MHLLYSRSGFCDLRFSFLVSGRAQGSTKVHNCKMGGGGRKDKKINDPCDL